MATHKGVAILHEDNGGHTVYVNGGAFATYTTREAAANRARKFSKSMGTQVVHVTEKTQAQRLQCKAFKMRGVH
jgi:hypothetical protein